EGRYVLQQAVLNLSEDGHLFGFDFTSSNSERSLWLRCATKDPSSSSWIIIRCSTGADFNLAQINQCWNIDSLNVEVVQDDVGLSTSLIEGRVNPPTCESGGISTGGKSYRRTKGFSSFDFYLGIAEFPLVTVFAIRVDCLYEILNLLTRNHFRLFA